jgi:hypothetical protein
LCRPVTELRQKAINAAVDVLVAPSSNSSPQKDGGQQLARDSHLTTENSPAIPAEVPAGGDVYDFNIVDDDDINVTAPTTTKSATKKRKRAKTAIGILPDNSGSDYEETTRPTKRKNTKQPKQQRSKTMPFAAVSIESDNVFSPDSKAQPVARNGRKSTRSNTGDQDLLPLLPKPRRKKDLTKELTDFLSAPALDKVKIDAENGEGRAAEGLNQAPGVSPRRPFMIDMTHDDLTLPTQKKDEYQPIAHCAINSAFGTPDLDSTIPDPPELYQLAADGPAQLTPEHPLPESMTSSTPPPQPASKRGRAKTDIYVGVGSGLDSIRIASEWRAAKGKGRQNLSDKQQPVNQPDDELAMHSDGGPRTTKKKQPRKTKQKESAKKKKGKGMNDKQIPPVPAHEAGDIIAVATKGTDDLADTMTAREQGKSTSNTADVNNTSNHVLDTCRNDEINVGSTGGTSSVVPIPGSPLPKKYLRTKTRLPPDSDDELGNPDIAPAKQPEPPELMEETPRPVKAKTSRKNTRSKVIPMSDDEDENAEFTEKKTPPVTKRKRTKSGTKAAEEDAPPLKKVTATKRGRTRSKIEKAQPDNELEIIAPTKDEPQDESIVVCGDPMTDDPKSEPKTPVPTSPEKKKLQGERSRSSHSPIRGGKIPYRVGLSKRARIEPLLSIRKK